MSAGLVALTLGLTVTAQWLIRAQADFPAVLLCLVGAAWARTFALGSLSLVMILVLVRAIAVYRELPRCR